MKKLLLTGILVLSAVFSAIYVFAAEQSNLTNLNLAEFLQGQLNIAVPAENKALPQDQYYNSLASALSKAGINNFQNTPFDTEVNFGELADVLFALVKGVGNLDTAGEIEYLVNNGFLTEGYSSGMKVTMADLQKIFANPKLSGLIAQTYVAPGGPGPTEPGLRAPGATTETPASQI